MKNPNETNNSAKKIVFIMVPVNVNAASALFTGLVISIVCHPFDRAFYLKNTDIKPGPLFSSQYWDQPFSGLRNTIYQRMLSTMIYFSMQGELNSRLKPWMQENDYGPVFTQMSTGLLAGMTTGFFSNGSYAVKYYAFRQGSDKKPLENIRSMWKEGGWRPFFKGIFPGIIRDSAFGITYELLNYTADHCLLLPLNSSVEDKKLQQAAFLLSRFFSATTATAISSPFNYVRNKQFATRPQDKQPSPGNILSELWRESSQHLKESPNRNCFSRMRFFQSRLMIGAGTARVGVSMAFGQALMERLKPAIQNLDSISDSRV